MRLDSITRVERFIVDALLASTQIPIGVEVIRLADTVETEGVIQQGSSIVVRYTGSSSSVQEVAPLTTLRTMNFEVTLSSQDYLATSGHDYVVQMCAGSVNTLSNAVPSDTGLQVFQPMVLTSEDFAGLTDNSIYVYTQVWNIVVQEVFPISAIDPCVARGNCRYLFPSNVVSTIRPGEVVPSSGPPSAPDRTNLIFAPVPPPSALGTSAYDPRLAGVIPDPLNQNNLIYEKAPGTTFIEGWQNYEYRSTNIYVGDLLRVDIYNKATGTLFMENVFYGNPNLRALVSVNLQMYISRLGQSGVIETSGLAETIPLPNADRNGYGYVVTEGGSILAYSDPTNPSASTAIIEYGQPYYYDTGVELTVEGVVYIQIGGVVGYGKMWVRKDNWAVVGDYQPGEYCEEPQLVDNATQPEGGSYPDTGRTVP
jgi:hypothetical protein